MEERLYYLGFSVFPGIGNVKFRLLLNKFGTAENAWNGSKEEISPITGPALVDKFIDFRNTFPFDEYVEKLRRKKISFVTPKDPGYPKQLLDLEKPPYILYVKGNRDLLYSSSEAKRSREADSEHIRLRSVQEPACRQARMTTGSRPRPTRLRTIRPIIAIVGTRTITNYGTEVTRMFTQELVTNGFTIVSGLAMGVDATAHRTALDLKGKTIAVLGCGVDCCYPSENEHLYDRIIEQGGAIVSEVPPEISPTKGSFLARNRIIAGLSLGVLVTEGAEDSGALTTAEYAFKLKRPVFAVPGPITSSLSKGPYKLINKGGKLVTSAEDITKELESQVSRHSGKRSASRISKGSWASQDDNMTTEEQKILKVLRNEAMGFDELVKKTGISSSQLATLLTFMEMKGFIKSADGFFSIVSI